MSNNDVAIQDLLGKVADQKKGLGKKPRGTWLTNGVFKTNSGSDFFNINTVADFAVLAGALGFLISQEEAFKTACKKLSVKAEFKWDGYTVDDWETDFKMRVSIVEYDKKKKTLDATEKKLNSLVSEEGRTSKELEDIAALLSS